MCVCVCVRMCTMWILPFVYSLVNNKTLFKSSADWKPTTGHTVLITSFGRRQMCNTTNFDRKHVSTAKLFIVSLNRASQLMANEWRNRMSFSARVMWMWNICWEWLELNTEHWTPTINYHKCNHCYQHGPSEWEKWNERDDKLNVFISMKICF